MSDFKKIDSTGKRYLDYRSFVDMQYLSNMLNEVKDGNEVEICSFVLDNNLIALSPRWLNFIFQMYKRRYKSTLKLWKFAEKNTDNFCDRLVSETVNWIVSGKDLMVIDSAGGYNQSEVNLLYDFVLLLHKRYGGYR